MMKNARKALALLAVTVEKQVAEMLMEYKSKA